MSQPGWTDTGMQAGNPYGAQPEESFEESFGEGDFYHHADASAPTDEDVNDGSFEHTKKATGRQMGGAAAVGGIAGMMVLGPIGLVAAAAGSAYLATRNGIGGGAARASGDAVVAVGSRTRQFSQNHSIHEKTKAVAGSVTNKAKEINEQHHVVGKTKAATSSIVGKAQEINQDHNVVEKTSRGIAKGANFVTGLFRGRDQRS
mmetsp:Transcript_3464/g.6324  ORF Transcript_3464/g.6324 Transcript_3464/m.6324 type:complete len:203 (-) Transcript_3464:178-786(-)